MMPTQIAKRLAKLADRFLRHDERNATQNLVRECYRDANLLAELLGYSRDQVRERAATFLRERGSHHASVSPESVDTSAPASSTTQGKTAEPLDESEAIEAPTSGPGPATSRSRSHKDAESHGHTGSTTTREGGTSRPSQPVAKLSRSTAQRVAKMSIFDKHISGSLDFAYRDITPRRFHNLPIQNAYRNELERQLRPIIHRAEHLDQPLPEYCSEAEMIEIDRQCEEKRQAALHAVKDLTYASK